jgi:hypothetical protein
VEDVLARPATVDPEGLDIAEGRIDPFPEEDADESDLSTLARPDADDDLVEALSTTLLDVDIATEGRRDGRREVVPGKFLGALIEGEVSVRDVDGLVRHHDIVTPMQRA